MNKEFLERAIKKAQANGWDGWGWETWRVKIVGEFLSPVHVSKVVPSIDKQEKDQLLETLIPVKDIIFDHGFAKAFWANIQGAYFGAVKTSATNVDMVVLAPWQYHLQQMIILEDPVGYLGEFLNG